MSRLLQEVLMERQQQHYANRTLQDVSTLRLLR